MNKILNRNLEILLVAFIDLLNSAVEVVFVKVWQFFGSFVLSFWQMAVLTNWIDLQS